MEKLIDLLNEYEEKKTNLTFKPHFWEVYGGHLSFLEYNSKYSELLCISKRYEFIKRLVENDKIDRDKSKIITAKTEIVLGTNFPNGFVVTKRYWLYEQLLMLLSIQNEPITFLVSVLK